jgi:hypothetical protein
MCVCVCVCVCVYVRVYENGGRETADTDELKGGIALGERERERERKNIYCRRFINGPHRNNSSRGGENTWSSNSEMRNSRTLPNVCWRETNRTIQYPSIYYIKKHYIVGF